MAVEMQRVGDRHFSNPKKDTYLRTLHTYVPTCAIFKGSGHIFRVPITYVSSTYPKWYYVCFSHPCLLYLRMCIQYVCTYIHMYSGVWYLHAFMSSYVLYIHTYILFFNVPTYVCMCLSIVRIVRTVCLG